MSHLVDDYVSSNLNSSLAPQVLLSRQVNQWRLCRARHNRHTFATYALVRSKDIRGVQEILGHRNIWTTQKYAHVLAREKLHIVNGVGDFVSEVLKKKADR